VAAPDDNQADAPPGAEPSPDVFASEGSSPDGPSSETATSDAPATDVFGTDAPPGDDAPASDAPANDATVGDDTGASGGDDVSEEPLCQLPLVDCAGFCVDTTMDPGNCGGCGTSCYSGICQLSHCVGGTTGAIVFIGHDYVTYSQAQARVLSNAVLLPQSSQTVPVLSYERYANNAALSNVKSIIGAAAKAAGRTLALTSTTADSDVMTGLTIDKYGVLLVADQVSASPGTLAALGASWMSELGAFTQAGGVVVILDGETGVGEMPELVTATGLLDVSAQTPVPALTQVTVVGLTDALALGVGVRYAAGANSASFSTEPAGGDVVYVVAAPSGDGAPGAPVVIHKVF
jgi:hypothetical protein